MFTNIKDVIRVYEIGLSTYLQSKGFTMSSFVDNNAYEGEFSPYFKCIDYHIKKGIPVIKKKILFAPYIFSLYFQHQQILPEECMNLYYTYYFFLIFFI